MQNVVQTAPNVLTFDIYILDTDPSQILEFATFQGGINFNSQILNGGAISPVMTTVVPGSSDLPAAMAPISVSTVNLSDASYSYDLIRIAGRAAPGFGGGYIVSTVAPGTRIASFTFTNAVPFTDNSTMDFIFNSNTVSNPLYPTRFAYYDQNTFLNTQATIVPGVNCNVLENPCLNCLPFEPPLAYNVTGGGSYCEGAGGLMVGLDGSQIGVDYTMMPGSVVVAGTGSALSFGMQLAGTYTVSGTDDGSDPLILGTTAMTGSAVVIENASSTVEVTEVACDSYTWAVNGVTYTTGGVYTFVDGCVTNVLNLTINPSSTVVVTAAACDTYTWALNGTTYTTSGVYTYVVGCVTNELNLTITVSNTVETTILACDSYTWAVNGVTYTTDGVYTFVDGCTTNILNLTITSGATVEVTEVACDTYTWAVNGVTYTASGTYTFIDGCITNILNLTINPSSTVVVTASACDTYTWALNGMTYTTSGVYTYVVGCVTNVLNLTITVSSTVEETIIAVDSYTWAINGMTYTASGDYTFVDGCTTYILHLTITVIPCPALSIWNGSVSSDWFDAANWTPALLPCATTVVEIPAGTPFSPTITNNLPANAVSCVVTLLDLHIFDGGSLIGQEFLCVTNPAVVDRAIVNSNFHLLSSPVMSTTFGNVFAPMYWNEVWAREYVEATGEWMNHLVADNMMLGMGYSVQMTTPQTATFTGTLNAANVSRTLSNVNPGVDVNRVGWNLLGNPFPSAIDWDVFSTGSYDASVAVWDQAGAGNYIYWNSTTSLGSLTNGIIPAQNGFFVKTMTDGASLTIPLTAQVHSSQAFYKDAVANALKLRADGNNYFDATFVHFNDNATPAFDSNYDAFKLEGLATAPQLYSIADYKLSINVLPFEGNEVVNLGFTCGVAGTYSVTASGMETFSSSTPILLEDLKLNSLQDLRMNPVYSFNYQVGDNANRFKLHFKNATGIDKPTLNGITVYSFDRTVVINNTTGLTGEVRIFDLTGRELKDASMNSSTTTRIPMSAAIGTYIVKVTTAQGSVNQKVFIK
jgi:hypothetical protein